MLVKSDLLIITADYMISIVLTVLGVTFDQAMNLDKHIKHLPRCFPPQRHCKTQRFVVSHSDLEMIIHASVSSRLDSCNSPLSASHPLTDCNSFRMPQPGLWPGPAGQVFFHLQPPWLAVNFRIHFNIPVITYWTIHGWAPAYISDLLFPYVARGSLRCIASGLTCCPLH